MGTERYGPISPAGDELVVCFEGVREMGVGGGGGARVGVGGRFGGNVLIKREIEGDGALRAGGFVSRQAVPLGPLGPLGRPLGPSAPLGPAPSAPLSALSAPGGGSRGEPEGVVEWGSRK
jgi:hypothetical protein